MQRHEYKVVPAPRKGVKTRGAKSAEDRFAAALEDVMNTWGAQGWEYVRSDTLPVDERQGLTGRTTVYQNMLVFRRAIAAAGAEVAARPVTAGPVVAAPVVAAPVVTAPPPAASPVTAPAPAPQPMAAPAVQPGARDPFSVPAPLVLNDAVARPAPAVGPAVPPRDIG